MNETSKQEGAVSYDIYQVKSGNEYVDYRFTGLQLMEQLGLPFSADNYEKVYIPVR
ncbi:MAG: hypothetical protein LIO51_07515 [Clostridiales bacterium]|nr:hypothetical protein [Clostridiales bacterium]